TQWIAVLDQLWQTRPHLKGTHTDENWYEWADIPYDFRIDVSFANACIKHCTGAGIRSTSGDYEGVPVDTGTLAAQHFLNPGSRRPVAINSNNVYHDWARTEHLGRLVREVAEYENRRIAVIGIGGLSARMFRTPIEESKDRVAEAVDDRSNERLLDLLAKGNGSGVRQAAGEVAREIPTDFGLKHLAFLVGALGDSFSGGEVRSYEPVYGTGAAVVELRP